MDMKFEHLKEKRDHTLIAHILRESQQVKSWKIDTTSISSMTHEETRKKIGIYSSKNVPSPDSTPSDIRGNSDESVPIYPSPNLTPSVIPSPTQMEYIDWHDFDDSNNIFRTNGVKLDFLTSIKNQYNCMACSSFAFVASIEANFIIQSMKKLMTTNPNSCFNMHMNNEFFNVLKTIDLSEWQLFLDALIKTALNFKLNPNSNVNEVPPIIDNVFEVASNPGICFEATYPYLPAEVQFQTNYPGMMTQKNCPVSPPTPIYVKDIQKNPRDNYLPPKKGAQSIHIKDDPILNVGVPLGIKKGRIDSLSLLKQCLRVQGPVVGIMPIKNDFVNYYDDGIYDGTEWRAQGEITQEMADELNGYLNDTEWASLHAVCIVGYDDRDYSANESIKKEDNLDLQKEANGSDQTHLPYFICKNSWGRCWGRCGWFNIAQSFFVHGGVLDSLRYPAFITQIDDGCLPDPSNLFNISPCEALLAGSKYSNNENRNAK